METFCEGVLFNRLEVCGQTFLLIEFLLATRTERERTSIRRKR
jgi:hypothetical protein